MQLEVAEGDVDFLVSALLAYKYTATFWERALLSTDSERELGQLRRDATERIARQMGPAGQEVLALEGYQRAFSLVPEVR